MAIEKFLGKPADMWKIFCFLRRGVFSSPEKGEKSTVACFGFIWQLVSNR
jgi:hypothetical protein